MATGQDAWQVVWDEEPFCEASLIGSGGRATLAVMSMTGCRKVRSL